MAVHLGHHYTDGISFPHSERARQYQLFGDALQNLCRETERNKLRIERNLFRSDTEKAQDIVTWEFGKPIEGKSKDAWFYEGELPSWEDESPIFSEEQHGRKFSCNRLNTQNKDAEDQCYLCSTMEEHQQHTAKRGLYPQKKKKPRPRIKFIPPPPTVKHKEKEIEEKTEVLYKFSVKTGSHPNAGTNANVTVKLKGMNGIMRQKKLKKKISTKFVFGRNTTEVFFVKGPEIGDLSMLAIEHDGLEQSHAWYLEEVEVTKMNTEQTWLFVCKDWLSLYHGRCELKKVLRADVREIHPREFEISVVTGDKMFAGTDANVYITLYGRKGVSKKMLLKNRSKDPFEKGSTENFFVAVKENIGPVSRIKVEHDNSGSGPGWLLEQVTVNDLESGQKLKFPCGQWLATDEGDGQIARDLYPMRRGQDLDRIHAQQQREGKVRGPLLRYEVVVLTGKARYAGTDARVYLTLVGKKGRSSEVELFDKAKDLFEMGQTDVFKLQIEDVGEIKRILIRHDNSGLGAGWFLEKVNIKRFFPKEEIHERLMKLQGDTGSHKSQHDEDSDSHSKQKVTESVKIKKKKDSESESDSDFDIKASNLFSSFQRKDKGKKGKKQDLSDLDSDDSVKRKYQKEKKKKEKKNEKRKQKRLGKKTGLSSSDSESEESDTDSDDNQRGRVKQPSEKKKMKWISYAGYRMQVTDDEKEENAKAKKKHKKKTKYPTDSSSDEEVVKHRQKLKKVQRQYSKYTTDSEEEEEVNNRKWGRNRKFNGEDSDSEEERSLGHRKKGWGKRGQSHSSDENEKQKVASMFKKDRVPFYDDYLFECHRWLAKDEDDGKIDREFKPQSVTTFYKIKK